jgi:hypothetical protein
MLRSILVSPNPLIMIYTTLKQLAILVISSIGLYYSGQNLITITSIESLLDALNVMIFFTCVFPFLILTINLSIKFFKSLKYYLKLLAH